MNILLLTAGQGGRLSVQKVHHQVDIGRATAPRAVNLLILDACRMDDACFKEACGEVGVIRAKIGLPYGVLLCQKPTLPMTVAAIRCGLRDVVSNYIGAAHLRTILQAANPGTRLSLKDYSGFVAFLRIFREMSLSGTQGGGVNLAQREHELSVRAAELAEQEKHLASERDALEKRDRDLRERTRRFDRQLARLQTDSDVVPAAAPPPPNSGPPFAEIDAMRRRVEKRAAELDVREKLLNEMQTLLMAMPSVPGGTKPGY